MEPKDIAQQMIDFQKQMFENTFGTIVVLQDQAERMALAVLDQATWLPEEARQAINTWVKSYQKGREDYKDMIHKAFEQMERALAQPPKKTPGGKGK